MKKAIKSSGFLGRLHRAAADQRGVAAVEFALIIPIMIGLYLMLHETANGLRAGRKVTMTARVLADLASRPPTISNGDRADIFGVSGTIMQPYWANLTSMRMTSVRFDSTGRGFVDWSQTGGASAYAALGRCAAPPTLPAGVNTPNSSIILAEVEYPYRPVIGYFLTGTITLRDQLHMRPRSSEFVQNQGGQTTTCAGWTP
jgi:Flp pilus assembly protein TadG